jgi:hypothetical protein
MLFFWFSGYICINYHIRKCAQTMSTVPDIDNSSQYHLFLLFISFSGYIVLVTIFGNVHRPCRYYCNIVNNSLHHVYSFVPLFSWFLGYIYINYHIRKCAQTMLTVPQHCQQQSILRAIVMFWFFLIFWLYLHQLPYLEMCTDHVISDTPTLSTIVYIMSIIFSLFSLILWLHLH